MATVKINHWTSQCVATDAVQGRFNLNAAIITLITFIAKKTVVYIHYKTKSFDVHRTIENLP